MKNIKNYYSIILFSILLLSLIFIEKYIYIAPNLNINSSLLFYSFIFILLFYIIVSILNTINSITTSKIITDSLREIFTPNNFTVGSKFIYYPKLEIVLTFSIIYFISHYIFITIYEATIDFTYNIIAFILSLLIGFILDQLLFIPLSNIPNLIKEIIIYEDLIKLMTANFIIVIFTSIIMLFIYSIRHLKR